MTFLEAFRQAALELDWTPEYLDIVLAKVREANPAVKTMENLEVPPGKEQDYVKMAKKQGILLGRRGGDPLPSLN